jgi:hypothetical protein
MLMERKKVMKKQRRSNEKDMEKVGLCSQQRGLNIWPAGSMRSYDF